MSGIVELNFYNSNYKLISFDNININSSLPAIEYSLILNNYLNGINFYIELNNYNRY